MNENINGKNVNQVSQRETRFRTLFEFAPDGTVVVDGKHAIIMVNDKTRQLTGYSKEELLKQPIEKLIPEEYSAGHVEWRNEYEHGLRPNAHRQGESRDVPCRRRDGTTFPADISVRPFQSDEGLTVFCIIRDITERKQAESLQRLTAAVFASTTDGIVVTDVNGVIQNVNNAFTQITGYTLSEVIGKNLRIMKSGLQDENFYVSMWQTLRKTGTWKGRFMNQRKNGEVYPQETTINEIRNSRGEIVQYCGIFRDVTEQMNLEEALRRLSLTDSLTGLANRRSFDETITIEWRRALRTGVSLAIIMSDIDRFKELNDTYGHQTGDECLERIGNVLKRAARRAGNLAARYGGDEFVILLPATSDTEAKKIAQEIRAEVEMIKISAGGSGTAIVVTLSMGIAAAVPNRSLSAEGLLSMADLALYRAKQAGRNRIESAT